MRSLMSLPTSHSKAGSGRPIDQSKTATIIAAASREFFKHGFAQTSIEAIAAEAGVSKVTIYKRFGTKEALFVAAVEKECDGMRAGLAMVADPDSSIRDQLIIYGRNMIQFLEREDVTRLENHLAVESESNPALGKLFLDAGPRRLHLALSELLNHAVARGIVNIKNTSEAAEHFAGMIKGFSDMDRRFGQRDHGTTQDSNYKRVSNAVDVFLRAYSQAG
jgi:TetR/AcrR family transcriptional regulator, mexJK operon transcriptional repressor